MDNLHEKLISDFRTSQVSPPDDTQPRNRPSGFPAGLRLGAWRNERTRPINHEQLSSRLPPADRTYIDRVTNRRLSKRAPSDYFAEIEQKQGRDSTNELLKSHLLPVGPDSSLARDDFDTFLADREERVLGLISRKTGADADPAESQQQMAPVSTANLAHGIYKITPAGHEELDNPREWARTDLPVVIVESLGEAGCSLAEIVNRTGDEDAVQEKLRKWMRQGWVAFQRD
jgi:hypothetical protein